MLWRLSLVSKAHSMHLGDHQQHGYTLVELLVTLVIAALLIAGFSRIISGALQAHDVTHERNQRTREAHFAMERMVRAVTHTRRLLLPLADKPWSDWPEHRREETVPPSLPQGSSTKATAVLAVTLPVYVDLDADGFPDADDDRDGLIDEDLPSDNQLDSAPGILLIDDDGDGSVDEGDGDSDDESSTVNDDPMDGIDNDDDNNVDEDTSLDMNENGCPGICDVDDDGDGQIDEGPYDDDDEDGRQSEDPYDPVVFYLNNGTLMERMPAPWDTDGISPVDGRDFISSAIAENVTRFRVERIPQNDERVQLVDLTLELTSPVAGEIVRLRVQARVGGAL